MKNTSKNNFKPDAMAQARKHPGFKEYSKEARARILLATELYNARAKKGLSQQELAKHANTTQKVVSKVENGEVNIGIDLMLRIIQSLDLKLRIGQTIL